MAITKINTPELFDLGATNTSLKLPSGPTSGTGGRPTNPSTGEWRYNTTLKYVEYYDGSNWRQIQTEEIGGCTTNTVDYPTGTTCVAYYKLDYSATDETTNNYDGTTTNITYVNGSPYSQAAVFNGSSSILLPNSLDSALGNNNFSYSFWINGPMSSTDQIWLSLAQNYFIYIGYFSNQIYISLYNDVFSTSVTISANTWTHIALVKSSSDGIEIYKDGVSAYTSTTAAAKANLGSAGNGQVNVIGRYSGSGYDFEGSIDQVRLFSSVLSDSQVTDLFEEEQCPCTTNTVGYSVDEIGSTTNSNTLAYYKLDGNANDSTANAYNGTWSGTEAYNVAPYGTGGLFNGSNSVITVSSSLAWSSSLSISMWLRPDSGLSGSTYSLPFMQKDYDSGTGGTGIAFYLYGYVLRPWISLGGTPYNIFNTGTLQADTWNHVVLTRTYNVEWELFLNGASLGTYNAQGLTNDFSGTEYYFGANNYSPQYYYDGQIDQVRIFNSALSSSQVTGLYEEVYCNTISTLDVFGGSTGLALYQFENNANSTDSSTYDGTWSGTEAYVGGYFGKAASFDGTSNILLPSNLISGTTDSDYSVSLWVKFDTLPGVNFVPLIGQQSGTSVFRILLYHSSGSTYNVGVMRTFGGTYYYNSPNTAIQSTFNVGQYYNVIVTYKSSNKLVNGYLNGNSIGSYTLNSSGSGTAGAPALGTYNNTTSYPFEGSIDQVRIFNTVLTEFQVLQLYSE